MFIPSLQDSYCYHSQFANESSKDQRGIREELWLEPGLSGFT